MVRPRPYTGYTYTVVYPVHGRNGRVCGPCTRPPMAVYRLYTAVHGPRTWSVRDPITDLYAARTRPCTVDTEVFTARVHGIVCAVYTAVQAVYGPCTPACKGRVHGASSAVYRVHLHGRVPCARPCLRPMYTAVHGRVQTVYTAVHGPRTWSVRYPITAVYAARTRPCTVNTALYVRCTRPFMRCTDRAHRRPRAVYMVRPLPYTGYTYTASHGRVQTVYTAVQWPRTWSVRDPITAVYAARTRPCTVNTAVFTARVHGIVRTVYTAVHEVYGPCTPACKGRVHGASTAVFSAHLHGRVLCTRPCLRPVYTAAHGRVQTMYTAMHGPRTWSVPDPITAVYAAHTRPCTVNTAVFTTRVHGIVRTVYTAVHGVYGPCTPACKGRVHGASTAVYRVHLHGRVPCTRTFTARVHGP